MYVFHNNHNSEERERKMLLLLVLVLLLANSLDFTESILLINHDRLQVVTQGSKDRKATLRLSCISVPGLPADFLAGGVAGTIASTLTAPLEVIKTQLQSSNFGGKGLSAVDVAARIYKAEGIKGFFRGVGPLLVGIIPTRAIYFWSYSFSKRSLNSTLGNTPLNHLSSAFFAGATSNTITNPLWMIKTRYQLFNMEGQAPTSYSEIVRGIWKKDGIGGFFRGLSASYVGCIEGGIQWVVYESIKKRLQNRKDKFDSSISPVELFVSAAFSKFTAICATYPHEVVRIRLRESARTGAYKYKSFLQALKMIAAEEGRKGLYGGMGIHLSRSVPNAAIMFLAFEMTSFMLKNNNNTNGAKNCQS